MRTCMFALIATLPCASVRGQDAPFVGDLRDAHGDPVAGAMVSIITPSGLADTTTTDDAGRFSFAKQPVTSFTVRAVDRQHTGHAERTFSGRPEVERGQVHLVIAQDGAAMEFSDSPGFTIAGMTDWTAVGGHGSDATLRTSEDLARQTSELAETAKPAGTADAAELARLEAAQRAAPDTYEANRRLGDFYLASGDYGRAERYLRTASALNGGAAQDEYAVALACDRLGDYGEAERHIRTALAKQDAGEFHRLAGEIREHLGDPVGAVEQFQRATTVAPGEENYLAWGSELLLHRAVWQAAQVFSKASALYPGSVRLRTGWAAALFAEAKYDEAAQQLCEASAAQPANQKIYSLLGKAALASPESLPCAQQRFAALLRLQPQNADAYYYSAMLLLQNDSTSARPQAADMLRSAVRLDPKFADAYLQLGILEANQGHTADAISLYRTAIQADPQIAEAHYRLGLLLDRTGRSGEAKAELALHANLKQAQAAAVEQERREVKQFLVAIKPGDAAP